jgi:hypothetical protein
VRGRCKATNLCRYCQRQYVRETVEMLVLDAVEYSPSAWVVLTAREHLTRKATHAHLRQLRRVAKRRWPALEWFVQVEFQRRGALHLNLLVKGIPADDVDELLLVLTERWCARVDALPAGQWAESVQEGAGVIRYISKMLAHGLKAEQAPPMGWKGHRTSQTHGYLVRPASVMRAEARRALWLERELWRQQLHDLRGEDAEQAAQAALAVADSTTWTLVRVDPVTDRARELERADAQRRARSAFEGLLRSTHPVELHPDELQELHDELRDAHEDGLYFYASELGRLLERVALEPIRCLAA